MRGWVRQVHVKCVGNKRIVVGKVRFFSQAVPLEIASTVAVKKGKSL